MPDCYYEDTLLKWDRQSKALDKIFTLAMRKCGFCTRFQEHDPTECNNCPLFLENVCGVNDDGEMSGLYARYMSTFEKLINLSHAMRNEISLAYNKHNKEDAR